MNQTTSSGAQKTGLAKLWIVVGVAVLCALVFAAQRFRSAQSEAGRGTQFLLSHTTGKPVTGGYSGWIGFKMTVGDTPLEVIELGRMTLAENTGKHTLKLLDASGQDFPGGSVEISMQGRTPGQITYGRLAAPVTLQAGASYYLVSSESVANNKGDFFYDYNSPVRTTAAARVDHPVFFEGGQWKRVGQPGESFGPLDFRYILKSSSN